MANKQLLRDVVLNLIEGNSEKAAEILSVFIAEKSKEMDSKEDKKKDEEDEKKDESDEDEDDCDDDCEDEDEKKSKKKDDDMVEEKWSNPAFIPEKEKGKHSGKTIEELKGARNKLKAKKDRTAAETSELKSINFAIRARTNWKSID